MNQENEKFLKTGLYYMGFGNDLDQELINRMNIGDPEFQLATKKNFNGQDIDYALDFKQSVRDGSNLYFWNGYKAQLNNNPEKSYYVEVKQNKGFTAKETANLLMGLAVCKEQKNAAGVQSEIWSELDFTKKNKQGAFVMNRYYNNHGFDMQAALASIPIKIENGHELPEWIGHAVRKGNLPDVTIVHNGEEMRGILMANPKERSIDVYSETGEMIIRQAGLTEQQKEKEKKQVDKAPVKQMAVLQKLQERKPRKPIPAMEDKQTKNKGIRH